MNIFTNIYSNRTFIFFKKAKEKIKDTPLKQIDYYAFGSPMVGRTFSLTNGYKFGFNGKENDNEVKGEGNSIDFGARVHDPRIGRFLSLDPLAKKYPSLSNYSYSNNNPIFFIDVEGKYFTGNLGLVQDIVTKLEKIATPEAKQQVEMIKKMNASDIEFNVQIAPLPDNMKRGVGGETDFNFEKNRIDISVYTGGDNPYSNESNGLHELKHGEQFIDGKLEFVKFGDKQGGIDSKELEIEAYKSGAVISNTELKDEGVPRIIDEGNVKQIVGDEYANIPSKVIPSIDKEDSKLSQDYYKSKGGNFMNRDLYVPNKEQQDTKSKNVDSIKFKENEK